MFLCEKCGFWTDFLFEGLEEIYKKQNTSEKTEDMNQIQEKLTKEEFVGYLKGNIIKHINEASNTNGLEAYKKASQYLTKLLEVEE